MSLDKSCLLLGLLAASHGITAAGPPVPAVEIGKPFPHLVLPSAEDGRPMSLADFRGKRVVLHVFASW